ncbi:class I SAM-dependent methyltransferase [Pseudonocardia charpentierae]|uniref:Class I SAM-dependent methyltransferase n=1 Tax=Pseudonocardia charpentierae TaxID=3075545 RepID=A0ABU2N6A1_9PSEU|nr:class I SAM-dependent methyltransferase [Pseudonocardia sp. DSM 45834]MDT0349466.1 class I SAM-dependent methyltransferase [Pseudonocardia sp. DSM 45834]
MLTETAPRAAPDTTASALTCRLCGSGHLRSFLDLGATPPCELFLPAEAVEQPEMTYPLHVRVCESCLLAQLPPLITPEETFTEYAYFSSFSTSWVEHARRFVDGAVERLGLGPESFVVEVASNDGYLLQHVVGRGIQCLGVEPSRNVGEAAREKGVPTLTAFLTPETGAQVRAEHGPADLVALNNVYAHIPDVVGFTKGLRSLVADDGWVSIEVQHLLTLVQRTQFDTIYHEHFQYYTVLTAQRALASGGLTLVDVELLDTHGGSVRLWARPSEVAGEPSQAVHDVLAAEQAAGLDTAAGHDGFATAVSRVRDDLVAFLIEARRAGKTVVGYGAPGKGNTLLNYCGIRPDLLAYTVDRNPYKHGRFTPGTRIPVLPPEQIAADRPDYVLVLPWNLRVELTEQLSYVREWGGRLVFPIPTLEVV